MYCIISVTLEFMNRVVFLNFLFRFRIPLVPQSFECVARGGTGYNVRKNRIRSILFFVHDCHGKLYERNVENRRLYSLAILSIKGGAIFKLINLPPSVCRDLISSLKTETTFSLVKCTGFYHRQIFLAGLCGISNN